MLRRIAPAVAAALLGVASPGRAVVVPLEVDETRSTLAVHGSFSELPQKLRARADGVLDRVSLYFPIAADDPDAMWAAFAAGCKA